MMQTRTTLNDISKALNLSVSTISKSLSGSSEISVLTQKRVRDFAEKCNYTPNHLAASFRKGSTNTIGLVIPNILNPFYAKVFASIENYLDKKDFKLITALSNESLDKESTSIKKMASGYVDGFIICVSKETEKRNSYEHINTLLNQGTPVVIFDRICDIIVCDKVIIDDYNTAYNTTEYLINTKGCKNLIMTSLIDDLHHGNLRTKGFENALKASKTPIKGQLLISNSNEDLKQKLREALKNDPNIDGVFGANEQAVLVAISETRQLNADTSKNQVLIAGFCNQCQTDAYPSLIVVNQNAEEIGIQTAELILSRIQKVERAAFTTKMISTKIN